MATIGVAEVNVVLKEMYGPDGIANLAYQDNPAFGMLEKRKPGGGKYERYAVKYDYASNRSRTPTVALNKVNTTAFMDFHVPYVADFDAKSIGKQAMEECTDDGAFLDLLSDSIDSIVQSLSNNAGSDVFNHRGAAIGQIASGEGTPTVTLVDPSDVVKFSKGQVLRVAPTNGLSGALEARSVTVASLDRAAGTVTATGNWTAGIATAAPNMFIFPDGDFGLGRAGFADWVPDDLNRAGLSAAFYNAVRSNDPSRLAGTALKVTGLPISQAIRKLAAVMGREEGKPDTCFMSFAMFDDLVTERDNKYMETRASAKGMNATIGFDGIRIAGARGMIDIYPDRSCKEDRFYLCKLDTIECIHLQKKPISLDEADGNTMVREASNFSYDIRGSAMLNFLCRAPVHLGVGRF